MVSWFQDFGPRGSHFFFPLQLSTYELVTFLASGPIVQLSPTTVVTYAALKKVHVTISDALQPHCVYFFLRDPLARGTHPLCPRPS